MGLCFEVKLSMYVVVDTVVDELGAVPAAEVELEVSRILEVVANNLTAGYFVFVVVAELIQRINFLTNLLNLCDSISV